MTVNDVPVTGSKRIVVWGLVLGAGVVLVGAAVSYAVVRLDDADRWGSVVGALVAVLSLPMTVFAAVEAYRARTDPGRDSGAAGSWQRVEAERDVFAAAGDQTFGGPGGASKRSSDPGGVRQEIRAGRDGFAAGGDQHFGEGRPR